LHCGSFGLFDGGGAGFPGLKEKREEKKENE